jgi:glycosyl transferase family 25
MERNVATTVINLAHRTDRRAEMESQLRSVGWTGEFFAAIRPREAAGFPSIGARGCFLSHLAVLRTARERGVSKLIILEDDLDFAAGFKVRWDDLQAKLDSIEWSITYAGHMLPAAPAGLHLLPPTTGVQCAHFVVIHRNAIATLIDNLEMISNRRPGNPLGGPMHVDGAYSTTRAQNAHLNTFYVSPVLGYQRSSRTDIGDLKWFDRMQVLRPLVAAIRDLKTAGKRRGIEL